MLSMTLDSEIVHCPESRAASYTFQASRKQGFFKESLISGIHT